MHDSFLDLIRMPDVHTRLFQEAGMSILTLFFCGTGFTSFDFYRKTYPEGELVSTLARNMAGVENVDWFLIDGVGTRELQKNQKFVQSEWLTGQAAWLSYLFGAGLGVGMESNAEHAVAMVRGKTQWSPAPQPLGNAQLNPRLLRKKMYIAEQDAKQQFWEQQVVGAAASGDDGKGAAMSTSASRKVNVGGTIQVMPQMSQSPQRLVRQNAMKKGAVRPTWLNQPAQAKQIMQLTPQPLVEQRQAMTRRHHPVTGINVVGWSRGAVTAHRFANKLQADPELRDIPVNIIAVDPVAGPLNNDTLQNIKLPQNVKRYVCFFARDDKKSFKLVPMRAELHLETRATFYSIPGGHATLVGKPDVGGALPSSQDTRQMNWSTAAHIYRMSPARLVRRLTERYLKEWGTVLLTDLPNDDRHLLEDYDLMVKHREQFRGKKSAGNWSRKVLVMGPVRKTVALAAAIKEQKKDCFINDHHQALFTKFHPESSWHSAGTPLFFTQHTWKSLRECLNTGAPIRVA